MASTLIVILLSIIALQMVWILSRARRAVVLLAGIKLHLREAKEEHWSALNAIHWALLAQIDVDERIPTETKHRLHDTPAQWGDAGRWRYHMPKNFFELDWREEELGAREPGDSLEAGGKREALARLLKEAGLT